MYVCMPVHMCASEMLHNPWYHLTYAAATDSVLQENIADKAGVYTESLKYLCVRLQIRLLLATRQHENISIKEMRD